MHLLKRWQKNGQGPPLIWTKSKRTVVLFREPFLKQRICPGHGKWKVFSENRLRLVTAFASLRMFSGKLAQWQPKQNERGTGRGMREKYLRCCLGQRPRSVGASCACYQHYREQRINTESTTLQYYNIARLFEHTNRTPLSWAPDNTIQLPISAPHQ